MVASGFGDVAVLGFAAKAERGGKAALQAAKGTIARQESRIKQLEGRMESLSAENRGTKFIASQQQEIIGSYEEQVVAEKMFKASKSKRKELIEELDKYGSEYEEKCLAQMENEFTKHELQTMAFEVSHPERAAKSSKLRKTFTRKISAIRESRNLLNTTVPTPLEDLQQGEVLSFPDTTACQF
jgi:hypothetical protein